MVTSPDRPGPTSAARFTRPRRRTLLAYGASALPFNWFGTFIAVHIIIFYTDAAGLDPFWIGFGMIAATLWGAVGDPLMGVLSDRTRWRWGRRRPYIVLGTILDLLFLTVVMLSGSYWLLFVAMLLLQFSSNIAHGALQGLIPDLVPEDQRGRASGVKAMMELLPAVLTALTVARLVGSGHMGTAFIVVGGMLLMAMLEPQAR